LRCGRVLAKLLVGAKPKTRGVVMVQIREVVRAASEAGVRMGVALEPWGQRAVREGVVERLVRAEDELELRRGDSGAGLRAVRRRLEVELWP
jgi:hypothetical protein